MSEKYKVIEFDEAINKEESTIKFKKFEAFQKQNLGFLMIIFLFKILTLGIFHFILEWFPKLKMYLQYKKCDILQATHILINYLIKQVENDQRISKYSIQYGSNKIKIPQKTVLKIIHDEIISPFYFFQIGSIIFWLTLDDYVFYACFIIMTSVISVLATVYDTKKNIIRIKKLAKYPKNLNYSVLRKIENSKQSQEQNLAKLNEKSKQVEFDKLVHSCKFQNIQSKEILPGDIIEIPQNQIITCDILILEGSCVINEAFITGESVPVRKLSIQLDKKIEPKKIYNNQNIIFSGSKCVKTYKKDMENEEQKVLGLVLQTGFQSLKGQLIKKILVPQDFTTQNLQSQSNRFLFILFMIFLIGSIFMGHSLKLGYHDKKFSSREIIAAYLNLMTIIVPPALPTCLSIGIFFALQRLQKKLIICISPQKIINSGCITHFFFDKTGTLTQSFINLHKIYIGQEISSTKIQQTQQKKIQFSQELNDIKQFSSKFVENEIDQEKIGLLACCQELEYDQETNDIIGDIMDKEIYNLLKQFFQYNIQKNIPTYSLHNINGFEENTIFNKQDRSQNYSIQKFYFFEPQKQRMACIVKNKMNDKIYYYVKGSFDSLNQNLIKETVPDNFDEKYNIYQQQGCRILISAYKELDKNLEIEQLEQQQIEEMGLNFHLLFIFINGLKQETLPTIQQINSINLNSGIITGDSLQTAVSVGYQSQILNQNLPLFQIKYEDMMILQNNNHDNYADVQQKGITMEQKNKVQKISFSYLQQPLVKDKTNQNSVQIQIQHQDVIQKQTKFTLMEFQEKFIENPQIFLNNSKIQFQLCIEGKFLAQLFKDIQNFDNKYKEVILNSIKIFARSSPNQKADIISQYHKNFDVNTYNNNKNNNINCIESELQQKKMGQNINQEQNFFSSMVGDGGNDMLAIQRSTVGISMGTGESSISAPLISQQSNISDILEILKQGKSALYTNLQCFKYMGMYSIIQFMSSLLVYVFWGAPGQYQYLFWDMIIIVPIASFLGKVDPKDKLTKDIPEKSLISFSFLTSFFGLCLIQFTFQIISIYFLHQQKWYLRPDEVRFYLETYNKKINYDGTVLFWVANFQYIIVGIGISFGKQFKKQFYSNKIFLTTLILLTLWSLQLLLYAGEFQASLFELCFEVKDKESRIISTMPNSFKLDILCIILINSIITLIYESHIAYYLSTYLSIKNQKHFKTELQDSQQELLQS